MMMISHTKERKYTLTAPFPSCGYGELAARPADGQCESERGAFDEI